MPEKANALKLFDNAPVRTAWDDTNEKWLFSIVDVVAILTESNEPQGYWRVLKKRLLDEGNETVTSCNGLKMKARDGKMRLTDVADSEQLLRLIQSIPSPKAEPFKAWLAQVGRERLDEAIDPELSFNRAIQGYQRLGYSEKWINQRIQSLEVRKALTDEWDRSGVRGIDYAKLTDLMSSTWSGMTTKQYKTHKGLTKENLRDHMTNTELVLNMLAEVAATDISAERNPKGYQASAKIAQEGAEAAKAARERLEQSTGKSVVSSANAKGLQQPSQKKLQK